MSVKPGPWLQLLNSSPDKAIQAFKNNPGDQATLLANLLASSHMDALKKAQFLQHENGFLASTFGGKRGIKTEDISTALSLALQKCLTKKDTDRINATFTALNLSTQIHLLSLTSEKDNLSPQDKNHFFDALSKERQNQILLAMAKKPLKDQVNFLVAIDSSNQQRFLERLSSEQQFKLFQEKDLNLQNKTAIFPKLKTNVQIQIITHPSSTQADKLTFLHKLDGSVKNKFYSRMANTSETTQQKIFNTCDLELQTEYLQHETEGVKIGPLRLVSKKPIYETTAGQNLFKNITAGEGYLAAAKQAVLLYEIDPQEKGKSLATAKLFACLSNKQKAELLNFTFDTPHPTMDFNALAKNLFSSLTLKQQKNLLLSDALKPEIKGELFKQLASTPEKQKELLTGFFNGFNDTQRQLFFDSLMPHSKYQAEVIHALKDDYSKAKALLLNADNHDIQQLKKALSSAKTGEERKILREQLGSAYEAQGKKQGAILKELNQQNSTLAQQLFNSADLRLSQRIGIIKTLSAGDADANKTAVDLISNMKPQHISQQTAFLSSNILNLETKKEAFNNIKNAYTQAKVLLEIQAAAKIVERPDGSNNNLPNELFKNLAEKKPQQTAAVLYYLDRKLASKLFQEIPPEQQAAILSELIDKKHLKTAERFFKALEIEKQANLLATFLPENKTQRDDLFKLATSSHRKAEILTLLLATDDNKQVATDLFKSLTTEKQARVLDDASLNASSERKELFDSLSLAQKTALFNTEIFNSDTRRELFSQEPPEKQAAIIIGTKNKIIAKFARDLGTDSPEAQINIITQLYQNKDEAGQINTFFRGLDNNPKYQGEILAKIAKLADTGKDCAKDIFQELRSPGQQIKILNGLDTTLGYDMMEGLKKEELATIFNRTMLHPNHLAMKNAQELFNQLAKEQPEKAIHVLNEGSGLLGRGKHLFKEFAKNDKSLESVKAMLLHGPENGLEDGQKYFKTLSERHQLQLAGDANFCEKFKEIHKVEIASLVCSQNNIAAKKTTPSSSASKHTNASDGPTFSISVGPSAQKEEQESVTLGKMCNK